MTDIKPTGDTHASTALDGNFRSMLSPVLERRARRSVDFIRSDLLRFMAISHRKLLFFFEYSLRGPFDPFILSLFVSLSPYPFVSLFNFPRLL